MKIKKGYIILGLIIIIGVIFFHSKSFARYTSNSILNYYLKSQGFYFESDDLHDGNNVNTLWDGGLVYFEIRNNSNQNLITEYDISYQASCEVEGKSEYLSCKVNGQDIYNGILSASQTCVNNKEDGVNTSSLSKTECELNGYTWKNQIAKNELYFEIQKKVDNYDINDVIVNVTVNSTAPYKRTLNGTYILNYSYIETGTIEKSYENYTDYSRLIVTNSYDTSKCVSIKWDSSTKTIDTDLNSGITTDENGYINKIETRINEKSNVSFIFYDKKESVDDFIIDIIECN